MIKLAIPVVALTLCACAGGDQLPHTRADLAPEVKAGADQTIFEGVIGVLHATINDDDGKGQHSVSWEQLSGPKVQLSGANGPRPIFKAPNVTAPTTLVFRVTVDDGTHDPVTDEMTITIENVEEDVASNGGPEVG